MLFNVGLSNATLTNFWHLLSRPRQLVNWSSLATKKFANNNYFLRYLFYSLRKKFNITSSIEEWLDLMNDAQEGNWRGQSDARNLICVVVE